MLSDKMTSLVKESSERNPQPVNIRRVAGGYFVMVGCVELVLTSFTEVCDLMHEYFSNCEEVHQVRTAEMPRTMGGDFQAQQANMVHGLGRALSPEPAPPIGWDGR
jgi:hypothetical protein